MSPARSRRDYAAEYAARKARAEARGTTVFGQRRARLAVKGFTTAQAAGHAPEGAPSVGEFRAQRIWHVPFYAATPGGGGEVIDVPLTYAQAVRAGEYMRLVRAVKEGDVAPDEFGAQTRNVTIAGYPVASDPTVAVALSLTISSEDLVFDSPRANAGRRS